VCRGITSPQFAALMAVSPGIFVDTGSIMVAAT
jgi:hypothetical protein